MMSSSALRSTESRKRNLQRASIHDNYDSICFAKEPPYSCSLVESLKSVHETSKIHTTSSQADHLSSSRSVSPLERMNCLRNRRNSLKEILFSPKVSFAFRNNSECTSGIRGLMNLGNTCYMNAALQSLSNCPPIRDYFLLNIDNNLNISGNNTNKDVSLAFRDLLMKIWTDLRSPIKPTNFLFQFRTKCAQFRGFGQQDAQEFIRCFLDILHQELKYPIDDLSKPLLSPSSLSTSSSAGDDGNSDGMDTVDSGMSTENESLVNSKESAANKYRQKRENKANCSTVEINLVTTKDLKGAPDRKETSEEEKEKPSGLDAKVNYESVVSVIFDGQLISTVKCLTCQHLSHTNETFQDISLSIPSVEQLEKMKEAFEEADPSRACLSEVTEQSSYFYWLYGLTSRWLIQPWFSWISNFYRYIFSGSVSLVDCLCAFFAADYLRGEDMYKCENCGKLRNGVKQCRLKSLPEILCIHLKRFRHDTLYNTKINTRITFPLRDLDFRPYMQLNEDDSADEQSYLYDLIAVVSHRGKSADFGHYIAYCLNQIDGTWHEFDDSVAHSVTEADVSSAEAYVLFYQKRYLYAMNEVDDF